MARDPFLGRWVDRDAEKLRCFADGVGDLALLAGFSLRSGEKRQR
jgi:hypothetical protein